MDKALGRYYSEMSRRINAGESLTELQTYHAERVREFQHERLVHLIITLFFAGLFLLFVGVFICVLTVGSVMLTSLAGLLTLILLVLEVFYIVYYYRLENGVQRLYELSKRLYSAD